MRDRKPEARNLFALRVPECSLLTWRWPNSIGAAEAAAD